MCDVQIEYSASNITFLCLGVSISRILTNPTCVDQNSYK